MKSFIKLMMWVSFSSFVDEVVILTFMATEHEIEVCFTLLSIKDRNPCHRSSKMNLMTINYSEEKGFFYVNL